jgi:hypothetical protein
MPKKWNVRQRGHGTHQSAAEVCGPSDALQFSVLLRVLRASVVIGRFKQRLCGEFYSKIAALWANHPDG